MIVSLFAGMMVNRSLHIYERTLTDCMLVSEFSSNARSSTQAGDVMYIEVTTLNAQGFKSNKRCLMDINYETSESEQHMGRNHHVLKSKSNTDSSKRKYSRIIESMDVILNEIVDSGDLKKFELMYNEQVNRGQASEKAQFEYAWCLVRSKYIEDMQKGVALLEDLFKRAGDDNSRRDYLYYLAVGYTRIKEYPEALRYVKALLKIEPGNVQGIQLQRYIDNKMKKEGILGMAIVGGAALAVGGLVGLGIALTKK